MSIMENRIGNNIRNLRFSYGETLEELAFSVGYNNASAISNFEGGRIPPRDALIRIAEHYNVPLDVLVHGDISVGQYRELPLEDIVRKKLTLGELEKMLPVVKSEEAINSRYFRKGLMKHLTLVGYLWTEGYSLRRSDFEQCMEAYDIAYQKEGICEAAANMLWWIFLNGISIYYKDKLSSFMGFQKGKVSKDKFISEFLLKSDLEDPELKEQRDIEWKQYFAAVEEPIIEYLRAIKKNPKWSDLAYYYNALRYQFGFIDNGLTREMNGLIGTTMLNAEAEIGNEYALNSYLKYAEIQEKLIKK